MADEFNLSMWFDQRGFRRSPFCRTGRGWRGDDTTGVRMIELNHTSFDTTDGC